MYLNIAACIPPCNPQLLKNTCRCYAVINKIGLGLPIVYSTLMQLLELTLTFLCHQLEKKNKNNSLLKEEDKLWNHHSMGTHCLPIKFWQPKLLLYEKGMPGSILQLLVTPSKSGSCVVVESKSSPKAPSPSHWYSIPSPSHKVQARVTRSKGPSPSRPLPD